MTGPSLTKSRGGSSACALAMAAWPVTLWWKRVRPRVRLLASFCVVHQGTEASGQALHGQKQNIAHRCRHKHGCTHTHTHNAPHTRTHILTDLRDKLEERTWRTEAAGSRARLAVVGRAGWAGRRVGGRLRTSKQLQVVVGKRELDGSKLLFILAQPPCLLQVCVGLSSEGTKRIQCGDSSNTQGKRFNALASSTRGTQHASAHRAVACPSAGAPRPGARGPGACQPCRIGSCESLRSRRSRGQPAAEHRASSLLEMRTCTNTRTHAHTHTHTHTHTHINTHRLPQQTLQRNGCLALLNVHKAFKLLILGHQAAMRTCER
jgi:hypothetical protein